ncbi:copper-binding protein [Enterobacter cloacae subsp. cloacae]|uniref:DsbA family protein n=1 Tax=Enterobacter cloacae TaxID=550 RepID=UPI0009F71C44|nr:DsbA family protein [Enterobacter cloacae]ORC23021.1 copper-binding protein [Enterobacter cloacae subsp. cloacae]ORC26912.1 copper-binding protein [Enterobacter cloacae subsp. cloacae]
MKKILITFLLFFASAQVMAADPITPDQEQRAQKLVYDFLFNDPDSPRIGAKNPKLTLVVFTDYNCPYCKKFDPYLEKIVEKHPEVAVVFKFLPFRSESSLTAARDALTVWRSHPEQFMKFNETLMAKKGYHDDASIQEAQKRAGVNVATPDDTSLVTVKRSLLIAEKLGIQGTPTTLIGEGLLPGWVPFEQFDEMVTDALKNR